MARVRSPNYPAISLPAALDKVRAIYRGEAKNAVAREVLAKLIGYGGLNGGSATMLSALAKYGLIESVGDGEARVSDLAIRIMFSDDQEEKRSDLETAAFKPAIFSEIREKWPDRPPSDESLRAFLGRKGFTENALEQVIQFYREIIDMVSGAASPQVSSVAGQQQETPMGDSTIAVTPIPSRATPAAQEQEHTPTPSTDKPFTIAFDGSVLTGSIAIRSVREIERLLKVLQAQKAAFEAMQEEGEEEEAAAGE